MAVKFNYEENDMLKIGVMIEEWKVPIFRRHFDAAGYEYSESSGLTVPETTDKLAHFKVLTKTAAELVPIVEAAMCECSRSKLN